MHTHWRLYFLPLILLGLTWLAGCGGGSPSFRDMTYNFNSPPGGEWSSTSRSYTPTGNNPFLGQFCNDEVDLTYSDLQLHDQVTLSFDLYILRSWDGNGDNGAGPDMWDCYIDGEGRLMLTTFSNVGQEQSFPGWWHSDNGNQAGAVAVNTLGYDYFGDAIYHMVYTFSHTSPTLVIRFRGGSAIPGGSVMEGVENESWGLDNVQVTIGKRPDEL